MQSADDQLSCESPWQRRGVNSVPASEPLETLPLRPRPTSYPGSFSQSNQPFPGSLSQSDSFPKMGGSPVMDQSELHKITGNSQSVETPNVDDDTQMTSISEDDLQQSLYCDQCSETNDVEDEINLDCEASSDPYGCNPESDSDQCKLLSDQDQCNLGYESDHEEHIELDSDSGLLSNRNIGSQTSFPSRSHDQLGDDEQRSCDTDDQSKSISVDRHSRNSSANRSMKNTAV